METKHTPGPWKVLPQGDANAYVILTNDKRWVIAFSQNGEIWMPEQAANAKLIEAAPDLLEAIKELLGYEGYTRKGIAKEWLKGASFEKFGDTLRKVEAAIEKATYSK